MEFIRRYQSLSFSIILTYFHNCRCMEVTGAYGSEKEDLNISLTVIGLLWMATDYIAKGLVDNRAQDSSLNTKNGIDTINLTP
jgi:quinol-cytochrome oxidoreductase complex cytochrome b subunit